MADWRKFIGKRESIVLPYFGGARVRMKDREVRLAERPESSGWYRFEIEGRNAKAIERAADASAELSSVPKLRGHLAFESLFAPGAPPEYVALMPEDEPALFASCTCHRWYSGELVFGEVDFETEAEGLARTAFEARRSLEWESGIPASLRSAFVWATVRRASRESGIPCSPREAWPHGNDIAKGGHEAAIVMLDRLEELRHGRRIVIGAARINVRKMIEQATDAAATVENAEDRAFAALEAAGARLTGVRRLAGRQQLEVHFDFGGERFITLVNALSLRVVDAGICLVDHVDGHRGDDELTLDSLPAAIREAMDLGVLVITRR